MTEWQGKKPYRPPVVDQKRERTIARLALLKAAANFAATREEIKSGDVVKIAALWEKWVLEP